MSVKGLHVVQSDGRVLLSRSYGETVLDERVISTFAATVPNISRSMFGEPIRHVSTAAATIHVIVVSEYVFLVHTIAKTTPLLVENLLGEFIAILQLVFGPPDDWSLSASTLDGLAHLIDHFCVQGLQNPCIALKGVPQSQLSKEAKFRLDGLLVQFESVQGICSNATMLVAGDALVYSRFEIDLTRQLYNFHCAMPLGYTALSWIPVHINGSWFNLVRARIGGQVLLVLCHGAFTARQSDTNAASAIYNLRDTTGATQVDRNSAEPPSGDVLDGALDSAGDHEPVLQLSLLLARVAEFQFGFAGARLDIAHEPAPPLLRELAPRDTLLLLCTHETSGLVVFPTMRPLPDAQRQVMLDAFWELFGAAQVMISASAVKHIAMSKDMFHFACASEGDCRLYAMFAVESVTSDHAFAMTNEMLEAFRQSISSEDS